MLVLGRSCRTAGYPCLPQLPGRGFGVPPLRHLPSCPSLDNRIIFDFSDVSFFLCFKACCLRKIAKGQCSFSMLAPDKMAPCLIPLCSLILCPCNSEGDSPSEASFHKPFPPWAPIGQKPPLWQPPGTLLATRGCMHTPLTWHWGGVSEHLLA